MGDKYKPRYASKSGKQSNSRQSISPQEYQKRLEFYKKRAEEQQRELEERLKQEQLEKEKQAQEGQKMPLAKDVNDKQGNPTKQEDVPFHKLTSSEQFE
ncbi:hypothetical protein, partial [uncultured Microscilla sp.]|uniref:hypothetical protein n=1 Tax=uncultured Microscilla sp. TaxID=432653 RepID=UPI00261746C6